MTNAGDMTNNTRIQRIVVPVDSLERRRVAVSLARQVSARLAASVDVVHLEGDDIEAQLVSTARDDSTLMCISTSARIAITGALTGSLTDAIVSDSGRNVLLVGPHCSDLLRGTQLAICVDGTPEGERIVGAALNLAAGLGLTPMLYQVLSPSLHLSDDLAESSYVASLAKRVSRPGQAVQFEILHDDHVTDALSYLSTRLDVAIVAMASHEGTPTDRLIHPSITHGVVRHAHCPVLVGPRHIVAEPHDHGQGPRVVVGIDGSPDDLGVLIVAVDEAARRHATLEVVHAWTIAWIYSPDGLLVSYEPDDRSEAHRVVENALFDIHQRASRVRTTSWLPQRNPADALLEAAQGADLVVVGDHHRGLVERAMLGSTTAAVLRHSLVPVLVVPVSQSVVAAT